MLLCPQCQFSNPNSHKFCQQCGISLTSISCPECRFTKVPLDAKECPNCQSTVGTIWLTMILPNLNQMQMNQAEKINSISDPPTNPANTANYTNAKVNATLEDIDAEVNLNVDLNNADISIENNSNIIQPSTNNRLDETESEDNQPSQVNSLEIQENQSEEIENTVAFNNEDNENKAELELEEFAETAAFSILNSLNNSDYIDRQKRYRVLQFLSPKNEPDTSQQNLQQNLQLEVLDCQPFLTSPVTCLRKSPELEKLVSKFSENKQKDFLLNNDNGVIPDIAKAYLVLENRFNSILPKIHDAWNQEQQTLVLLENRWNWPLLADQWRDENFPILQGLHWWHKIAELWQSFREWHCTQSLLILDNLRVDEDQVLCLDRKSVV